MKTRSINALCILIVGFLLASILVPGAMILASLIGAILTPNPTQQSDITDQTMPVEVYFIPTSDELINPTNTLKFNNSQELDVVIHKGIVMAPDNIVHTDFIWRIIIYALMFVAFVLLMIDFIKFIININKGYIFDRKNINYLNRFGLYLIAIALLDCIDGLVKEYYFSLVGLTMNGYEVTSDWEIPGLHSFSDSSLSCSQEYGLSE